MKKLINKPKHSSGGFGLIEVMVALLVISIGLLGIASMQAVGIKQSNQSRLRALAAFEAASMVNQMRANPGFWHSSANFSSDPNAPTTYTVDDQGTLTGITATDCAANVCTPPQMAGGQVQQWGSGLQALPNGNGRVECSAVVGAVPTCLIKVSWTESEAKAANSVAGTTAAGPQSYQLTVTP